MLPSFFWQVSLRTVNHVLSERYSEESVFHFKCSSFANNTLFMLPVIFFSQIFYMCHMMSAMPCIRTKQLPQTYFLLLFRVKNSTLPVIIRKLFYGCI